MVSVFDGDAVGFTLPCGVGVLPLISTLFSALLACLALYALYTCGKCKVMCSHFAVAGFCWFGCVLGCSLWAAV